MACISKTLEGAKGYIRFRKSSPTLPSVEVIIILEEAKFSDCVQIAHTVCDRFTVHVRVFFQLHCNFRVMDSDKAQ
jgi:hypothetical protein